MPGSRLKILVADGSSASVQQLEQLVRDAGHLPLVATDARSTLERFATEVPDLVFLGLDLPDMAGSRGVEQLRSRATEKWTPIILLAAQERTPDILRCLEAGGDDYVFKPASEQLLRAKIKAYARLLAIQRQEKNYIEELRDWRADAEEQNRLGAHVMARLTDADGLRDALVRAFNQPTDTFSGDLLCAARAPNGVLNVMLADATGHGLSAALSAMPLTQVFYSMTAKGFPLASIAAELNRKLKAILPADRFVAATLAALDVHNQTLEVWNGGNPDALFVNAEGQVVMQWASSHPPLGILPDSVFSSMTETALINEPGDLLLCSDGLVEAENPAGQWLGLGGVVDLLVGGDTSQARFNRLLQGVEAHLDGGQGRDDISFLMVSVPIERRRVLRVEAPTRAKHEGDIDEWHLSLTYSAAELRYLDVVPAVLGLMTQLAVLKPHQGTLFLIISELFNNALDHGLLCLDSTTKHHASGFEAYMQQRADRLSRLQSGHVALSFLIHEDNGRAVLDMDVTDSGQGFDHESLLGAEAALAANRPHGRGIALVRSLCENVVYSGNGNRVWARYLL